MRHSIAGNRLNRKSAHRKATIRDIAKATLIKQRILTTKAKAKEARKLVDKLITLAKGESLANKRRAFSILCDHKLVSQLFNETAIRFKKRAGGYSRIIPMGTRVGDNAHMVYLELTEKKEVVVSKPKSKTPPKLAESVKEKTSKEVKDTPVDVQKKEDIKEPRKIKEKAKQPKQKMSDIDKGKSDKKFLGGIRKMFTRKTQGK